MNNKKCSRCQEEKDVSEFYSDKRPNRHLYSRCKECIRSVEKEKVSKLITEGLRKPLQLRISEPIQKKIIDLYSQGFGCHVIGKNLKIPKSTVMKIVKKSGILREGASYRKYKFKNENFFDLINSETKAYFLGLLWADGCNYRREGYKKQAYQIHIVLQEQDGYILSRLASEIYHDDSILRRENKTSKSDDFKRKPQIRLRIPSKHISQILENYGMTSRKSFTLEMPKNIDWSEDLMRAFIRGFFDGDGSVYYNSSSKHYGVSFISSVIHMKQMQSIVEEYTGIKMGFYDLNQYSCPMAALKIHGNLKSEKFLDWIYLNSEIHLERKYIRYINLKDSRLRRKQNNQETLQP